MDSIFISEIVSAGIYNAQIAHKNKALTPNRKTAMFEIELPIGDGGVSYIDDEASHISENTVICAKPGQIRHTRLPFKCYYIHIVVKDGTLLDILSSLPNFIKINDTKKIRDSFLSIIEHYNKKTREDELMLHSIVLKLIYELSHASQKESKYFPKSNNKRAIEYTLKYIKENLSSELTLTLLSKKNNFSTVYFHKLFKASTGKNLREYIEDERIKKAIELLISTEKNLTEIAYECGFSSQSYFSYAFKRKMNITPREYAKKIQLKYENEK